MSSDISFASSIPTLLSHIQSSPTGSTIEALSDTLISQSLSHPSQIDVYADTVKQLVSSPDAQNLVIKDIDEDPESSADFVYVFILNLSERLKDILGETALGKPKHLLVDPSNPVLAASVLSASLIQSRVLSMPRFAYAFTKQGLKLPDTLQEPEREEIVALGACLHLSIAGKNMLELWLEASDGLGNVVKALKGLDEEDVVKYEKGKLFVKTTITNAEVGFVSRMTAKAAWLSLFPETKV